MIYQGNINEAVFSLDFHAIRSFTEAFQVLRVSSQVWHATVARAAQILREFVERRSLAALCPIQTLLQIFADNSGLAFLTSASLGF
jgi:hypothetical protein